MTNKVKFILNNK